MATKKASTKDSAPSTKNDYPVLTARGTVFWCKVFEPNQDDKFSLDLVPEDVSIFEKYDIKVKEPKDDGAHTGDFVSLWTYAKLFESEELKDLEVFDAGLNPWDPKKLIGNGSLIMVEFRPKDWEYKGKTGTRAELLRIQVLKHVPYMRNETMLTRQEEFVEPADESSAFASQDSAA